jgi:putative oxidoreductase
MKMNTLNRHTDAGLLLIRVGLGLMFMFVHGYGKLFGGPDRWARIGSAMASFGLQEGYAFWGFAAAFAEFFGGLLLVLGLFFRPALALMLFTMMVAATSHFARGEGVSGASHAIEVGIALAGLLLTGPGRYSLDARLFGPVGGAPGQGPGTNPVEGASQG